LQRAVAEGGLLDFLRLAFEPALGVGVGKELWQMMIEVEIIADDGADRRLHRLLAIAFREKRLEPFLGLARFHEQEARRAAIGACRPEFHEID
jgi:hypothetical protein